MSSFLAPPLEPEGPIRRHIGIGPAGSSRLGALFCFGFSPVDLGPGIGPFPVRSNRSYTSTTMQLGLGCAISAGNLRGPTVFPS